MATEQRYDLDVSDFHALDLDSMTALIRLGGFWQQRNAKLRLTRIIRESSQALEHLS
jgi:endonuclease III-like uncharacterized protein